MTSSPRSSFEFLNRRALYLGASQGTVYQWGRNGLSSALVFDTDETGINAFARYMHDCPRSPMYLLVDLVEEEYHQESIPHVGGGDREALCERRMQRLFRGTRYVHAEFHGREPDGRKDDIVVFSAITNPDALHPWLRVLDATKTPLAGIYSVALLSEMLLPKLQAAAGAALLITLQSGSGMRQSFFQDGKLKISRLARLPRRGTVPYGPFLLDEVERIRLYLNSLRLLPVSQPLDVHIVVDEELAREMTPLCSDNELARFHLVTSTDLSSRLGIANIQPSLYSNNLYAHLLLAKKPKNQFANGKETRYFALERMRLGMLAASLVIVLAGAAWGGLGLMQALGYQQDRINASHKADFYQARYQSARARLPKTPVGAYDLKTAVQLVAQLHRHKQSPLPQMQIISQALGRFPALKVDAYTWVGSADPNASLEKGKTRQAEELARINPEVPYTYYQIGRLQGYLEPFDGNYRQALEMVNEFAEALRRFDDVVDVRIEELPLDVSSEARLTGAANDRPGSLPVAKFSLKIVLGVGHESV